MSAYFRKAIKLRDMVGVGVGEIDVLQLELCALDLIDRGVGRRGVEGGEQRSPCPDEIGVH